MPLLERVRVEAYLPDLPSSNTKTYYGPYKIKLKVVGMLLGTMIFLWFVFLHIPRAIADPFVGKGNEVTSAFEALGFSGIAFVLAYGVQRREKLS